MAEGDPHATQQNVVSGIAAELRNAGFDDITEVGHGGFGVVYRCTQPSLDRIVAVKVLTADLDPDNVERFVREQRAMGRLSDHPHIVTILEVGAIATGRPFIVMPYHAKDSLEALIRRHGPLDWRESVSIGVKLAGALEAAQALEEALAWKPEAAIAARQLLAFWQGLETLWVADSSVDFRRVWDSFCDDFFA